MWRLARTVGLSVDPGSDTTWSVGEGVHLEPTAVAVDASGHPRACGAGAVLAAARRGSGLRLCRPYTSAAIFDPELARWYLLWLLERSGGARRRTPMMVVVPACSPSSTAVMWRELGESLGARPMVVERPVAAVAGLGLEGDSGIAHLIVDAEADATEVAVVVDGRVVASRRTPPLRDATFDVAAAVKALLVSIDPDHEIDIADSGVYLVGREVGEVELAEILAAQTGLAVSVPENPHAVVVNGARKAMEAIRPYLSMVVTKRAARTSRTAGFRDVRGVAVR